MKSGAADRRTSRSCPAWRTGARASGARRSPAKTPRGTRRQRRRAACACPGGRPTRRAARAQRARPRWGRRCRAGGCGRACPRRPSARGDLAGTDAVGEEAAEDGARADAADDVDVGERCSRAGNARARGGRRARRGALRCRRPRGRGRSCRGSALETWPTRSPTSRERRASPSRDGDRPGDAQPPRLEGERARPRSSGSTTSQICSRPIGPPRSCSLPKRARKRREARCSPRVAPSSPRASMTSASAPRARSLAKSARRRSIRPGLWTRTPRRQRRGA